MTDKLQIRAKKSNFVSKFQIEDMTRVNHIYIYTILLAFAFSLFSMPSFAQKKEKSKKKSVTELVSDIQPDPIGRKARPDRLPKSLDMPSLVGGYSGGTGDYLHGIDVSHYQGRIDWDAVAKDPKVNYVYLKATEGVNLVDDTYRRNFNECKRVGLKVGSYLFFRPNLSARAQFDLFVSVVDTKKQDLLPLIDAEAIKGVSIHVFQTRLLELCNLFEREYGKKPIIYTGKNFYNKNIHGNPSLRAYKYFIAAYTFDEPELYGGDDFYLWQYSATGSVHGIRGNVDLSRLVGRHTLSEILY